MVLLMSRHLYDTMTAQNIISVFNLATETDRNEGSKWYGSALTFAYDLHKAYGVPIHSVVGVIAALSPRNRWERNKQDAESMIKVFSAGGDFADLMELKVCTFSSGKKKAAKILTENASGIDAILAILKGPKLQEFFSCIVSINDEVCIDGHAYSIWIGDRVALADVPSIGVKLRRTIKEDYREAARTLGVKPHVVQAVTWVCWRRLHGV